MRRSSNPATPTNRRGRSRSPARRNQSRSRSRAISRTPKKAQEQAKAVLSKDKKETFFDDDWVDAVSNLQREARFTNNLFTWSSLQVKPITTEQLDEADGLGLTSDLVEDRLSPVGDALSKIHKAVKLVSIGLPNGLSDEAIQLFGDISKAIQQTDDDADAKTIEAKGLDVFWVSVVKAFTEKKQVVEVGQVLDSIRKVNSVVDDWILKKQFKGEPVDSDMGIKIGNSVRFVLRRFPEVSKYIRSIRDPTAWPASFDNKYEIMLLEIAFHDVNKVSRKGAVQRAKEILNTYTNKPKARRLALQVDEAYALKRHVENLIQLSQGIDARSSKNEPVSDDENGDDTDNDKTDNDDSSDEDGSGSDDDDIDTEVLSFDAKKSDPTKVVSFDSDHSKEHGERWEDNKWKNEKIAEITRGMSWTSLTDQEDAKYSVNMEWMELIASLKKTPIDMDATQYQLGRYYFKLANLLHSSVKNDDDVTEFDVNYEEVVEAIVKRELQWATREKELKEASEESDNDNGSEDEAKEEQKEYNPFEDLNTEEFLFNGMVMLHEALNAYNMEVADNEKGRIFRKDDVKVFASGDSLDIQQLAENQAPIEQRMYMIWMALLRMQLTTHAVSIEYSIASRDDDDDTRISKAHDNNTLVLKRALSILNVMHAAHAYDEKVQRMNFALLYGLGWVFASMADVYDERITALKRDRKDVVTMLKTRSIDLFGRIESDTGSEVGFDMVADRPSLSITGFIRSVNKAVLDARKALKTPEPSDEHKKDEKNSDSKANQADEKSSDRKKITSLPQRAKRTPRSQRGRSPGPSITTQGRPGRLKRRYKGTGKRSTFHITMGSLSEAKEDIASSSASSAACGDCGTTLEEGTTGCKACGGQDKDEEEANESDNSDTELSTGNHMRRNKTKRDKSKKKKRSNLQLLLGNRRRNR